MQKEFWTYASHVIKAIIHPLGLAKGKLHLFHIFFHGHGIHSELLKLLVPFIIGLISFIPTFPIFIIMNLHMCGLFEFGFFCLMRRLPIFLRTSLCSSTALNILCAVSSLIGVTIVTWDDSPSWNTSSWCVSLILTKFLPCFSRTQIGIGMCLLNLDGKMVPEKKSYFIKSMS